MRKADNKKKEQKEKSSPLQTLYRHKRKKATTNLRTASIKAGKARTERRRKALESVPLDKLLDHLQLKQGNSVKCPFCTEQNSIKFKEQECYFRCSCCKKRGTIHLLVKQVKQLSDWEAIYYMEKLGGIAKTADPLPANIPAKKTSRRFSESEIERVKRDIPLADLVRSFDTVKGTH